MVTGPLVSAPRCAASPSRISTSPSVNLTSPSVNPANSSKISTSPSNNPTKSSNGATKCTSPATKCGNFGTGDGKNDWKRVKIDEKYLPVHGNGQKATVRPSTDVPAEEKRRRATISIPPDRVKEKFEGGSQQAKTNP